MTYKKTDITRSTPDKIIVGQKLPAEELALIVKYRYLIAKKKEMKKVKVALNPNNTFVL